MNLKEEKTLIGYIYNAEGKHSGRIYLENDAENIARFIARGVLASKIMITDTLDFMCISTFGSFLDRCTDKEYMEELLRFLLPMQMGEIDPFEKEIKYTVGSTDYQSEEEMKAEYAAMLKEHFNYTI